MPQITLYITEEQEPQVQEIMQELKLAKSDAVQRIFTEGLNVLKKREKDETRK